MKVIVLSVLVLGFVLLGLEANAQGIGIRAGFQSATTNNNGNQIGGSLDHFYLGAFKNRHLGAGDLLTLHTGLEYMQNGHSTNDDNFRRMIYLSVPVGIRLKLGPVFVQGGVNGNIKLSENYQVNGSDALNDGNKTNTFDLPAHIGLGLKLLIFEIEARYHQGFIDVNNGNKNSYLQIGAAIEF
ncbi:PorT family protein [Aquiflexum gelatinilyticum]|uniref:PorT family protein n=1 Tax=Aquiflexum gelatinilyticum TaxID=2961943 RepID=UPI0021684BA1|nr:PorT family protein [Aquiflexum gelatinilyticum]MCS4436705.1 PorT family protein [Aquiflexum gelatinilyticum]